MDMLEGIFGVPVYSETKDKPIRSQMTKRVASETAGHPGPSKLPKCSKEVEYITPLGFPVETDFGIGGMINKPEREWRGSPYISAVFQPVASLHRIVNPH